MVDRPEERSVVVGWQVGRLWIVSIGRVTPFCEGTMAKSSGTLPCVRPKSRQRSVSAPHPGPGLMKRPDVGRNGFAGQRGVCGALDEPNRRAGWRQPPDRAAARRSPGADAARLACVGGETTLPDWMFTRTDSTAMNAPFLQATPSHLPRVTSLCRSMPFAGERGQEVDPRTAYARAPSVLSQSSTFWRNVATGDSRSPGERRSDVHSSPLSKEDRMFRLLRFIRSTGGFAR